MNELLYKKFSVILYTEPTYVLLSYLNVEEYAFILHDKDMDDNGEIKKAHYHLYLKLTSKKRISTLYNDIVRILGKEATQPFLIQNLTNERSFQRYLIHADDLDKYQYSLTEIVSNLDLSNLLEIEMTDTEFVKLCRKKNLKNFNELVDFCLECGKIELVMQRAYFFKMLLNIK